jgi:hypothetical protein
MADGSCVGAEVSTTCSALASIPGQDGAPNPRIIKKIAIALGSNKTTPMIALMVARFESPL